MSDEIVLGPQEGAQELAISSDADVVIYGGAAGSGKSHLLLLKALLKTDDPLFNAIIFRRTTTALRGGLWKEAKALYQPWKPRQQDGPMRMIFKSGAEIKFNHMEHEKDAVGDHQGQQYSLVCFDEGTHFTEYQVTYLMSRLRSGAEGDSQMFISCNPDPDSFICEWIHWWLDEEGYPIPERSGKKRFYYVVDNQIKWGETQEELVENYPDCAWMLNPKTGKKVFLRPKTMTFISGTIFDNPALIEANPRYLSELNSLPEIEKARLLHGNWYVRPKGSNYFDRGWLLETDRVPPRTVMCRAWDKASTEPSDTNTRPDYTACTKMHKDQEGRFYIVGDHHPDNHDKRDRDVLGRFRERPGTRDQIIAKQADYDGKDCTVIFSKDPGSAGETEYTESAKKLIMEGFRVCKDPMPPQTSKLARYSAFSSACENGLVYIVKNTFSPASLEAFLKEHEAFDGERSSRARKDDWPDSTASAFNWLCKKAVIPSFTLESFRRDDPFS